MEKITVLAAFDWLSNEEIIGTLGHERLRGSDIYSFEYSSTWLTNHKGLLLSDDLKPYSGIQYNIVPDKLFGCFSDALPDRWGRKLIDLRTRLNTSNSKSSMKELRLVS